MNTDSVILSILSFFGENAALGIFLASAIGGIPVIIFLGGLAAGGFVPLWKVVLFSFLGSLATELFWFFLGRASKGRIRLWRKIKRLSENIERVAHNNLIKILIMSRIVYGTKTAAFIYLGRSNTEIVRFLFWTVVTTLAWIVALIAIGWLAGRGIISFVSGLEDVRIIITVLAVIVIIVVVWLRFRKTN